MSVSGRRFQSLAKRGLRSSADLVVEAWVTMWTVAWVAAVPAARDGAGAA